MHLVIDAGNTLIKLVVFNDREIVHHQAIEQIQPTLILDLIKTYSIESAILASTRELTSNDLFTWWPKHINLLEFDNNLKIPIGINYKTPETLGRDRLAGAIAAHQMFSNQHILIISMGTAITIDYVSESGNFEGGIISPGMNLRFKALHTFTGKLPLVDAAEKTELSGLSTTEAIQFGVQNSIIFEINEYFHRYKERYKNIYTILTGGDADLFKIYLSNQIKHEPFLVSKGLNEILIYNIN